jgi:hypothetical protein
MHYKYFQLFKIHYLKFQFNGRPPEQQFSKSSTDGSSVVIYDFNAGAVL